MQGDVGPKGETGMDVSCAAFEKNNLFSASYLLATIQHLPLPS